MGKIYNLEEYRVKKYIDNQNKLKLFVPGTVKSDNIRMNPVKFNKLIDEITKIDDKRLYKIIKKGDYDEYS